MNFETGKENVREFLFDQAQYDLWELNGASEQGSSNCTFHSYCTEILYLIEQLLGALNFMNKNNLAHLDIKPENILIENGKIKV